MDKPFNLHHTYANQVYYATRQIFGYLNILFQIILYEC
jgi:hypothetical protein